jgi:peptidyl-prolyl cis-trans isomerase D
LVEQPSFQGIDGNFDRSGYDFFLQSNGMTENEFEDTLRIDTARALYQQAIATGIKTPEALSSLAMEYISGRRDFAWGVLSETNITEGVADATLEQLTAFHSENPDEFTLPEKKRITYAWVSPESLVNTIEVPEADLRKLYDERAEVYIVPERRMVERLNFPDAAQADAAKARLDSGDATFSDIVTERGLDLADIDLGDASRADLGDAADAVFALTQPGLIGPLETDRGPALFRMNAILTARETSFEDAMPLLRAELANDAARRKIGDELENIDDLLAGGNSLEDLANETDLELGTIDWSPDLSDEIARYDAFREAALELNDGDFEKAILLEDGGVVAIRLDEILAPRLQDLQDVRPAVAQAWRSAQVRAALTKMADDFATQFAANDAPETYGMTITVETGLTRTSFVDGTPADFMERVFALEDGEVTSFPYEDSVIIVRLNGKAAPDLDDPAVASLQEGLEAQMAQSMANDVLTSLAAKLTSDAGLTINSAVIAAVHANFPQ